MHGLVLDKIREPWNEWTKRTVALDVVENDIKRNLKQIGEG